MKITKCLKPPPSTYLGRIILYLPATARGFDGFGIAQMIVGQNEPKKKVFPENVLNLIRFFTWLVLGSRLFDESPYLYNMWVLYTLSYHISTLETAMSSYSKIVPSNWRLEFNLFINLHFKDQLRYAIPENWTKWMSPWVNISYERQGEGLSSHHHTWWLSKDQVEEVVLA